MKAFSYLLLLFGLLLVGCNKNDGGSGVTYQVTDFEVHIQHNFDNDRVVVELDGKVVFDDYVTTNPVLGLAKIVKLQAYRGTHHVRAILRAPDGTLQPDFIQEVVVDLNQPVYICLTKNVEQVFKASVKKERPMYD